LSRQPASNCGGGGGGGGQVRPPPAYRRALGRSAPTISRRPLFTCRSGSVCAPAKFTQSCKRREEASSIHANNLHFVSIYTSEWHCCFHWPIVGRRCCCCCCCRRRSCCRCHCRCRCCHCWRCPLTEALSGRALFHCARPRSPATCGAAAAASPSTGKPALDWPAGRPVRWTGRAAKQASGRLVCFGRGAGPLPSGRPAHDWAGKQAARSDGRAKSIQAGALSRGIVAALSEHHQVQCARLARFGRLVAGGPGNPD